MVTAEDESLELLHGKWLAALSRWESGPES